MSSSVWLDAVVFWLMGPYLQAEKRVAEAAQIALSAESRARDAAAQTGDHKITAAQQVKLSTQSVLPRIGGWINLLDCLLCVAIYNLDSCG